MTQCYIIWEQGDEYHGSGVVTAYHDYFKALKASERLQEEQPRACPQCDHKYSYSVITLPFADTPIT